MDYEYLHEVEAVKFRSEMPRPRKELLDLFLSQGFTLHDDVVSLDRQGKIPPWQHSSIVEVEARLNSAEVFDFDEGMWDELILKYLFASLPFELSKAFIQVVNAISRQLGINPLFRGHEVDNERLTLEFDRIRDELLMETGEDAGSEGLAILIHSTYPRR